MNCIVIIGMTQQGKSPFTKQLIRDEAKNCLVFDYNNEYGKTDKYGKPGMNLSNNILDARCRYTGTDFAHFLEIAKKKRNSNIVFEEATAFLKGQIGRNVLQLVIGKAHTRNNYIFIFHSIRTVPPGLLDLTDTVVLFRTNDNFDFVKKRDQRFIRPFVELHRNAKQQFQILEWGGR